MTAFVAWLQHDTAGLLTLAAHRVACCCSDHQDQARTVHRADRRRPAGRPGRRAAGRRSWSARRSRRPTPSWRRASAASSATSPRSSVSAPCSARSWNAPVARTCCTSRLLRLFGPRARPLAMGLTGLIFGIPVFFDIGIFVLAPLVYVAAKRGGQVAGAVRDADARRPVHDPRVPATAPRPGRGRRAAGSEPGLDHPHGPDLRDPGVVGQRRLVGLVDRQAGPGRRAGRVHRRGAGGVPRRLGGRRRHRRAPAAPAAPRPRCGPGPRRSR